jgi:hypothetical protein
LHDVSDVVNSVDNIADISLDVLDGVQLLPSVGAYNIPAAKLATDRIPVYPRGVLISTASSSLNR